MCSKWVFLFIPLQMAYKKWSKTSICLKMGSKWPWNGKEKDWNVSLVKFPSTTIFILRTIFIFLQLNKFQGFLLVCIGTFFRVASCWGKKRDFFGCLQCKCQRPFISDFCNLMLFVLWDWTYLLRIYETGKINHRDKIEKNQKGFLQPLKKGPCVQS